MESTINLIPGMKASIGVRTDLEPGGLAQGSFAYTGATINYKGTTYDVVNGWVVEDSDVGLIEADQGKPAVLYTHKKPEKNALYFFNQRGSLKSAVYVVSVPIHDHSSIVQGGPAYATYFSDDESIE